VPHPGRNGRYCIPDAHAGTKFTTRVTVIEIGPRAALEAFRVPSQRITIAKLAGVSGDIALERLAAWSAARSVDNPNLWSPEQWPVRVREQADDFAEQLRLHGTALPVCSFVEWTDMWSMGYLFPHWLTPPGSPRPIGVHANRFEVFAYGLPDEGRLAAFLAAAGPQQFSETDYFLARLQEAVRAWEQLVPCATLVVLRQVVGGYASDEEVTASLQNRPAWLA
jgi:hypothetical protein